MSKFNAFERAIYDGDTNAFHSILSGVKGEDLKQFAEIAYSVCRNVRTGRVEMGESGRAHLVFDYPQEVIHASEIAVLLTGSVEQLKGIDFGYVSFSDNEIELFKKFNFHLSESVADVFLENDLDNFKLVREWLQQGICSKPQSDNYLFALIRNFAFASVNQLTAWLIENQDVLQREIWRIFEVDLASSNRINPSNLQPWGPALKVLSDEGHLARSRLLKASLDALNRDFKSSYATWFTEFHELLKPTVFERCLFLARYGTLLASPLSKTVSMSLDALTKINDVKPIERKFLEANLAPVMVSSTKGNVLKAIKLLKRNVESQDQTGKVSIALFAAALTHESPEVQHAICDVIQSCPAKDSEELRKHVTQLVDLLAPSVIAKLPDWFGAKQNKTSAPVYLFSPSESGAWLETDASRIEPISTLKDLIAKASYCLEHPEDAIEIERVLDGVSRISTPETDSFKALTAALRKRAVALSNNRDGSTRALSMLAAFLDCWLHRTQLPLPRGTSSLLFTDLIYRRMVNILGRVRSGIFLCDLALPTHTSGWINPQDLAQRLDVWNNFGQLPATIDVCWLLMRVPHFQNTHDLEPLYRDPVLGPAMKAVKDDQVVADQDISRVVGWLRNAALPSETLALSRCELFTDSRVDPVRGEWIAIAAPNLIEGLFADAVRTLAQMLDDSSGLNFMYERACFQYLTHAEAPLGRKAIELLAIGLISRDAECVTYSKDAVIAAIDRRRLDLQKLSLPIRMFLHSQRSKPKRLAGSLADIARVGDLHADAVRQLLELCLQGNPRPMEKTSIDDQSNTNIVPLLELFREMIVLCDRGTVVNRDTINYLETIKTSGKTAKLIKEILTI